MYAKRHGDRGEKSKERKKKRHPKTKTQISESIPEDYPEDFDESVPISTIEEDLPASVSSHKPQFTKAVQEKQEMGKPLKEKAKGLVPAVNTAQP